MSREVPMLSTLHDRYVAELLSSRPNAATRRVNAHSSKQGAFVSTFTRSISGANSESSQKAGGISMKTLIVLGLLLALANATGAPRYAVAQTAGKGMVMPATSLLVAQLDSKQVVGGSTSRATGMGAFLIEPVRHTLTYSLTYQGLQAGPPKAIALFNFGKGRNGGPFKILCGRDVQPCPGSESATITGKFEKGDTQALDYHTIGEFDSQRIYVEIVGGNGEREIRGQLAPNSSMAPIANYVAQLAPVKGSESKGTGTAVVSEIYLPGGKVSVFYAATVANTSGPPVKASLAVNQQANARPFTEGLALPKPELLSSRENAVGGSLRGQFEVGSADPNALYVNRLLSAGNREVQIVITTNRHPDGELLGTLVPVR